MLIFELKKGDFMASFQMFWMYTSSSAILADCCHKMSKPFSFSCRATAAFDLASSQSRHFCTVDDCIEKLAADMKQGFSEMKAEMVSMARSIAENARGIAELRSDFHSWTAGPAAKIVMCFGSALAVLLLFMLRNPRKVGEIWAVVTGTAGLQQQVQGAQQEHRP